MAPEQGLRTWATADTSQPTAAISGGLEVQLAERQGAWARIVCSNGWSTWVDGRELIDVVAMRSMAEALIDRLDAAVREYQQVVTEAAEQRIDQAEFKRRAFHAGMIVSDGEAWFFDLPNARWCRYDGFGVTILDPGAG
jgi:hypothetical protein